MAKKDSGPRPRAGAGGRGPSAAGSSIDRAGGASDRERGAFLFVAWRSKLGRYAGFDLGASAEGRAIEAAGKGELVGVMLAAMEEFSRIADDIRTAADAWNVHHADGYSEAVTKLLARLLRRDLGATGEEFERLAGCAARFPCILLLGCPHYSALVAMAERMAERGEVTSGALDSLERVAEALAAGGRADEMRLAARVGALLRACGRGEAAAERPSPLERMLLERESIEHAGGESLTERLVRALVVPERGDQVNAAVFLAEGLEGIAPALEVVNGQLSAATSAWNDVDRWEHDGAESVDAAVCRLGIGGAVVLAAAVSALSIKQIRPGEDERAARFNAGARRVFRVAYGAWPAVDALPATELGELCDAMSRFRGIEYAYPQWGYAAERVAIWALPVVAEGKDRQTMLQVLRFRERIARSDHSGDRAALLTFDRTLGIGVGFATDLGERWSDRMFHDLKAMPAKMRRSWQSVLGVCAEVSGSKPSAAWSRRVSEALRALPDAEVEARLGAWFGLVGKARPAFCGGGIGGRDSSVPSERGADLLRGLAWAAGAYDTPGMARALGDLAMASYKMVPGVGARCVKAGTSAVWALSQMTGTHALSQLSRVRQLVKFGTAKKVLDATLERLAAGLALSTDELHELAAPDFELSREGTLREEAGEFTLELGVGDDGAAVRVLDASGNERKSVPASVKDGHAETLKAMKQSAADINKMLPAQKDRLERLYQERRSWTAAAWRERYIEHPLVGSLARRLIWRLSGAGGEARDVLWQGGDLRDVGGRPVALRDDDRVTLWHPVGEPADSVAAWRTLLEAGGIRQPFKQAHREVYVLTDAEDRTQLYSNRFAAHIVRQAQLVPLCQQRGWMLKMFVLDAGDGPSLRLPRWGLRVEWIVQPVGDEYYGSAGAYAHLQTDQVRFFRAEADEPERLADVPALAFSEAMRDVDLFVGVCSVGNNPEWHDGGPGGAYTDYWRGYAFAELSGTGRSRRDLLARLLPRLSIGGVCSLSDRFLEVRGGIRNYKIHLGSGNILMSPNDQYLCIVAAPRAGQDISLPFEGDAMLSVILSKAFLLAEDAKISDPSITRQIRAS